MCLLATRIMNRPVEDRKKLGKGKGFGLEKAPLASEEEPHTVVSYFKLQENPIPKQVS